MKEIDKSPKGEIDPLILPFMDVINQSEDYETTSSCSGRISVFIEKQKSNPGKWLYVSHSRVTMDQEFIVKKATDDFEVTGNNLFGEFDVSFIDPLDERLNGMTPVYFKFEPFILHVSAPTVQKGQEFMQICLEAGFAYTALVVTKKRTMIQIKSSLKIDTPIGFFDSERIYLVVDRNYISLLVKMANAKFDQNEERMDRLLNHIKRFLQES